MNYTTTIDGPAWITTLADARTNNTVIAPAPSDWNGSIGAVDLAKPVDYTNDWGKLIRMDTDPNNWSLRGTLAYYIWLAQEKHIVGVNDDVIPLTAEQITKIVPYARILIARYRVYRLAGNADLAFAYRAADMRPANHVPVRSQHNIAADHLYMALTAAGDMEALIADAARMVMFQAIANGIHREQNDGHEWFSTAMTNATSPTSKTLGVAGRDKERFKTHMAVHGHNSGHHLAGRSLDMLAKMLAGTDLSTFSRPTNYRAEDVNGLVFHTVVNLGASSRGRYPAGVLGKAAMITGLAYAEAMVNALSAKALLSGHAPIAKNLSTMVSVVRTTNYSHEQILLISNRLGPTLAFVYGFCDESGMLDEGDCVAYMNHSKRHIAEKASGKSLAKTFARATPHAQAVQGAIIAALVKLSDTIAGVASINIGTLTLPVYVSSNLDTVDNSKIGAIVGKRPVLAAADTFYESNN